MVSSRTYEWDSKNRLIKTTSYAADGTVDAYTTRVYNEDGSYTYTSYSGSGAITYITEFDSNDMPRMSISYWEGGYSTKYVYGENGKMKEYHEYDPNGICVGSYEYDENGVMIKYITYDNAGNVYGLTDYYYNSDGTPSYYTVNCTDGTHAIVYVDSNWDNAIAETYYEADGSYSKKEFTAGSAGHGPSLTRLTFYRSDDTIMSDVIYSNGSITKASYYDDNGVLNRVYEHDESSYGSPRKGTFYKTDGTVDKYFINEFCDEGYITKQTYYYADGTIGITYFSAKNVTGKYEYYNADGTLQNVVYYNESGVRINSCHYLSDGGYSCSEYDAEGVHVTKSTGYSSTGTVQYVSEYVNSKIVRHTTYNTDGGYGVVEYDAETGDQTSYRFYDKDGNLQTETLM